MNIKIEVVENNDELNSVLKIRRIVFIEGQNVPENREIDGLDDEAIHILVLNEDIPIGTARMRIIRRKIKLERIALLDEYRGKGIGKRLLQYLINLAKSKNPKEIIVHTQYYAKEFYEKYGFKQRGDKFMDAGIEHIEMYIVP